MKIQTYYCKDENDNNLFSVELTKFEVLPWLRFKCSLGIDFRDYPEIQHIVDKIRSLEISEEERNDEIQIFFFLVKKIRGVEKRFFNSHYNKLINKVQDDFILDLDDYEEYSPVVMTSRLYYALWPMLVETE